MFVPCNPPPGSSFSGATPSGSIVVLAGILNAIQCVISVAAFGMRASGSCRISTKLTVPFGTFFHCSSGEMPVEMCRGPPGGGSVAAHVYFTGIGETSANEVLDRNSDGPGPRRAGANCCAASSPPAPKEIVAAIAARAAKPFISSPPSVGVSEQSSRATGLLLIAHAPHRIRSIVRHHQRPVLRYRHAHRTPPAASIRQHEAGQKILVRSGCVPVFHERHNHFIAGAYRTIPRAMLGHEKLPAIFLWELLAFVECEAQRSVMRLK